MKKELAVAVTLFTLITLIMIGLSAAYFSIAPAPMSGAACKVSMSAVIASAQGDVYNPADVSDGAEVESSYLAIYAVQGDTIANPKFESVPPDLLDEQENFALQNEAWQVFTDLVPPQNRRMVAQFNVFTDGYSNTLAAADQTKEDLTNWVLEIDVADLEDKDALMFTLIHEYGHILTLNATQMEPDQAIVDDPYNQDLQKEKAAACPNFFTGMGCSYADSYIDDFYNRFWLDINDEWAQIDALQYDTDDFNPYYAGLYRFYKAHQDQFLDDYSVTHPDEDIAEAFTYFVFSPKPTGNSIKEQKVAFFYQYPELVKLRENILNGACKAAK